MNKRDSDWYISPNWFFAMPLLIALPALLFFQILVGLGTVNLWCLYKTGMGMGAISIVLLLVARMPLYKAKRFWTIGPRHLDKPHRRIYWLAYVFFIASAVLFGAVWLRTHGL